MAAWNDRLLEVIDQRVARALVEMHSMGTIAFRDTGNRAMVVFDGSSVAVPCKVPTNLEVVAGDRVVLLRMGSDRRSRSAEYVVVATFGVRPVDVSDTDVTSRTTTSTTLTPTLLTGGIECAVAFTAPPPGRVLILFGAEMGVSGLFAAATVEVRQGDTIGSGTVVFEDPSLNDALRTSDAALDHFDMHVIVGGLTAGARYHVMMMAQVAGGATGTYARRKVTVIPLR